VIAYRCALPDVDPFMTNTFTLPSSLAPNAPAVPTDLLIGESWREGAGRKRFDVEDPSTGKLLTTVADGTIEDGIAAVDAAAAAAAAWAATSGRTRAEILRKCFERIVANVDWLTQLISMENGKSLADARSEVMYAAEFFRWYAEEAPRVLGEFATAPSGANHIVVRYQPIGISLLVTPWNFPAAMATRKIAPALAAGCTVILKPAAETPLTSLAVAQIMREAGVPAGVVNIVTTKAAGPVCDAILHDPRVRKVSFTGSTPVGRVLLREAADQVISSSMELGGNAPFVVFDDADIPQALDGAMIAKMRNGGEACTAANRFYVQRGVYDQFAAGIVERMSKIKVGVGYDPESTLGPMINRRAVDKIESLVQDAVSKGAKVLLGGKRLDQPGYYYPPTVLGDIPKDAHLLKEEIFGPVVALRSFDTEADAIAAANDTELGLAAYVYTRDLKRGFRVCEQIETGMIGLNRGMMSDPAAPFGGMKQSGLGREGSHHGLIEFCEAKYVAVSW
jgi:succinate-semialdehyde dehydrogenase/glutarate-semialdehyde dehydrogenase